MKWFLRLSLFLGGFLFALLFFELYLRNFSNIAYGEKYYLWPPNLKKIVAIENGVLPGISGSKRFYINQLGVRGREPSETDRYRILVFGGSTVESGELDEDETWVSLLEKRLNVGRGEQVWVGNAGRRGGGVRDHILQLKYFEPQIGKKINEIMMLSGVNDLMLSVNKNIYKQLNDAWENNPDVSQLDHAFSVFPVGRQGLKSTAIWSLLKKVKLTVFGSEKVFDREGEDQVYWRGKRMQATKVIQTLPDLSLQLKDYEKSLRIFVRLAKMKSEKVILLTQPSIWKTDMAIDEEKLLWFGCMDEGGWSCFDPGVLAQGLDLFNRQTLEVCKVEDISCIDLASEMAKNTDIFADDVHFNEEGSRQVSKVVFEALKKE